ncbi:MAG TPA: hypothetical protein VGB53_03335 [Rubricoccaceae bacterium]
MDREVKAVTVGPDGSLYAAGSFTTVGGPAASHAARWDGTAWHSCGDGVSGGAVYALGSTADGLVVLGGDFAGTGGHLTPFVAAVRLLNPVAEAPAPQSPRLGLAVGPNPTHGAARAYVTTETAARVRRLRRARAPRWPRRGTGGRARVRLAADRAPRAGRTEHLAPGVYVVRLVAGDRVQTVRLVVAR